MWRDENVVSVYRSSDYHISGDGRVAGFTLYRGLQSYTVTSMSGCGALETSVDKW